jgi:hypothetical protein
MEPLNETIAATLGVTPSVECDNCFEMHTTADFESDPCAVKTMLSWAFHTDRITKDEALAQLSKISPDTLWDRLGDLLDDLVSGAFNCEE